MKIIKSITTIVLILVMYSCSSDDSENVSNEDDNENSFVVGSNNYEITNAYLFRSQLGNNAIYSVILTKGEIIDYNSESYSNDFRHAIGFGIKVPLTDTYLNNSTYVYDIDGDLNRHLSSIGFANQYVVENNQAQSFNSVFNQSDIVNEDARIIVNKLSNGNYNFNFNAITTIGQINGSFTGAIQVLE